MDFYELSLKDRVLKKVCFFLLLSLATVIVSMEQLGVYIVKEVHGL